MLITLNSVPRSSRPFDDVMRSTLGAATSSHAFRPAIDVEADAAGIEIVCDVPGMRKEDLDITLEKHTLTLRGTRRFDGEQGEHVVLGRAYGSFSRAFALSDDVDVEQLRADLADGVLTIHIPIRPRPAPRKIEIDNPAAPKRLEG